MKIRPLQPHEHQRWVDLRHALWPDYDAAHIEAETRHYFARQTIRGIPSLTLIAEASDGALVGFAEVSLRPYARGCISSPVGYLEGWYVEPAHRRRGVGRALVAAAEQWARSKGCSEFASDRVESNLLSRDAHYGLNFQSADRCQHFHKGLADAVTPAGDFVGIMDMELYAGTIAALVHDSAAGGIAVFLGTTRTEKNAQGQDLIALDYEAYEAMALKQMHKLAATARQRWPIVKLALLHRTGRVKLAEPSVVIAVSTPHRGDAFDACRFLIDELKKDVAIWKKEVWADGTGTWVHSSR